MAYKHVKMCSTPLGITKCKLESQCNTTAHRAAWQKLKNLVKSSVVKTVVFHHSGIQFPTVRVLTGVGKPLYSWGYTRKNKK